MSDTHNGLMPADAESALGILAIAGDPAYIMDAQREMAAEPLAAHVEAWARAADDLADAARLCKEFSRSAGDALLARLGDGEAVRAPSGRWAIRTIGRDGRAAVRKAAFDDMDPEALPPHLRPRMQTTLVLPGVTELRKAAHDGLITWEQFRELVSEGPKVPRLSWRKLPTDGGEE